MTAAKRLARVAGALYLLVAVLGGIAQLGVHTGIRVPGDAAATAAAPTVAEFWMILYLVTKGVRVPRPDQLAPAAV